MPQGNVFIKEGSSLESAAGIPGLGIGLLGYAFMGKAHSNGYRKLPYIFWPPPAYPKLAAICGRKEKEAAEAAQRYGYSRYYTDWRDLVADPDVQVFDNSAANNVHLEPTLAAIAAGKHVICEKPLAMNAAEARQMWQAADRAGVKHMVGFNYRFVPAIRLARWLIDEGRLGEIVHFRAKYLQEWISLESTTWAWRFSQETGGKTGILGDLGSHIIDLGRFLVGEPHRVMGKVGRLTKVKPLPDGSGE
ncbi:MAG: Gfo/Idh/MocA family protein, partial [Omnitrophica WOR_2 bacterium]